jgi:hypothetical protein
MMNLSYTPANILRGLLIYASGDTVAAFLLGQFAWGRLLGMMLVGATFYALEIPNYFRWIDRRTANRSPWRAAMGRTGLALLYFNPLWIARHLFFIAVFSGRFETVHWDLLSIATRSFLVNIPISLTANFIIQNRIKLKWRFFASAVFSALMAIYYALSEVIFR